MLGDVGRGDRAEEGARLARRYVEADLRRLEPGDDLLRMIEALRLLVRALLLVLAQLRDLAGRRRLRQLPRQQVVARVAGLHAHDFAARTKIVDVFT